MLRHVVCMKFDDISHAQKAKEMLLALNGKVESLINMEVGLDILKSERSYDLVLIADFEDLDALHAYDKHPEHEKVRSFIKSVRRESVSVDFQR